MKKTMMPTEAEIKQVMTETGMGYLQAVRNLQQRKFLMGPRTSTTSINDPNKNSPKNG